MNESSDTRAALLAAARVLFARHGYDGASIKAITSRAHANLGAVTYHFATKERLYHEVLRSIGEPFLEKLKVAAEGSRPPLARIESLVRTFFNHLCENSDLPSLILHELSLSGPVPPPLREVMGRIFGTVTRMVEEGQRDGTVVRGDPTLLAVSIMSLPAYIMLMRVPLHRVAGLNVHDLESRDRILDHVVLSIRRSLSPRAIRGKRATSQPGLPHKGARRTIR
jgi:AcrR family transcriptional regulator